MICGISLTTTDSDIPMSRSWRELELDRIQDKKEQEQGVQAGTEYSGRTRYFRVQDSFIRWFIQLHATTFYTLLAH